MTRLLPLASVGALALLAGCGQPEAPQANVVTTVNTSIDANVTVPAANEAAPVANETAAATPALNVAPDGVSLVSESGSARQVIFGSAQDAAVTAVSAALGKPTTGRNEECGQGPMDTAKFAGGITLFFMEKKFVGWDLDDTSKLSTASGVGIGTTLKEMRSSITVTLDDESTLGHEFASGDLGGLLSNTTPAGKVTALWAGSTCQFR